MAHPDDVGCDPTHSSGGGESLPGGAEPRAAVAAALFIRTNDTSPLPASISAARSASLAWRHALHQTCTRYPMREIERGVGSSCASVRSLAIGGPKQASSACRPGGELSCRTARDFRLAYHSGRGSGAPRLLDRYGHRRGLVGDLLPAGHVVADQRHAFRVGHPAGEGARQIAGDRLGL
jgi:hypothetical protein